MERAELSVLLATPQLEVGGAEKLVVGWAKELHRRRVAVAVVSGGGPLVSELEQAGIRHYLLTIYHKSPLQILRNGLALRRIIKERGANVLHAQSLVSALACRVALYGQSKPKRLLTTIHLVTGKNQKAMTPILGHISDLTLTCSQQMRHELIKLGLPPEKVKAHPNAIDLGRFASGEKPRVALRRELLNETGERLVVITVARLEPDKGHRFLLEAIARLRPELRPLFLLVGNGSLRFALEAQIRKLNLQQSVRLLGERHDIAELLAASDLFVLPSIREGLPVAIIEAMAARLPVLATRVDGVPELVQDDVTGRVITAADVAELEKALMEMLCDPTKLEQYGQAGQAWVMSRYDIKAAVEKLIEHYRDGRV